MFDKDNNKINDLHVNYTSGRRKEGLRSLYYVMAIIWEQVKDGILYIQLTSILFVKDIIYIYIYFC